MLTDTDIKALPKRENLIACGNRYRLYIRTRKTGRKTFVIRRRVGGDWHVETLSPDWPKLTLLNARRRAAASAAPVVGSVETFEAAASRFCQEVIDVRYRSSAKETRAYFTRDCKKFAKQRLDRAPRADIDARWPRRDYASLHAHLVARAVGWHQHDLRRTAATRMRDAGGAG